MLQVLADIDTLKVDFKDLQMIQQIGEGGFGKVFKVRKSARLQLVRAIYIEDQCFHLFLHTLINPY